MATDLSSDQLQWAEYFRDIGFSDIPTSAVRQEQATSAPPMTAEALRRSDATQTEPPNLEEPSMPEELHTAESESLGRDSRAETSSVAPSVEGMDMDTLRAAALACLRCGLSEGRQSVVFADGDSQADLMFIGEGPGAQEDRQGLPFVGPAGQLLDKIVSAIGWTRETVYIANIVKCRPPGNRDPEASEVEACIGYLHRQIDLVKPQVLVALGRVAAQTLLGTGESLGRLRERWHEVRGVPTYVTYHPAALLRNESFKRPTWEDMQVVRDRLGELS